MSKCKCPPAGAPEWVLTYGDMMSLLLTFFILLAAFSELKKPQEYKKTADSIQAAFGMPVDKGGRLSLIYRLTEYQLKTPNISEGEDPGIQGKNPAVTKIREGFLFTRGGRVTFEVGSAELSDEAKAGLKSVAGLVRGYANKIELKGHASPMEMVGGISKYPDLWALSYARSKAVMDYLTSGEVGLEPERFRLIACGDREPLVKRVYDPRQQEPNRRAEVVVTESLVEDMSRPEGP